MSDRYKASVARHLDNKIRPRPPQEYICLIGGVTNTFNGWFSWIEFNDKFKDAPNGDNSLIGNPMPEPHNRIEVDYYLHTPKAVDLKNIDKAEWKKYGWSEEGGSKVVGRGWEASDLIIEKPQTHDLYWANYVDPAARLYSNAGDLPLPHKRPKPQKGDIVTFFIYWPCYRDRQAKDWKASPFHFDHHGKTIDPKDNPIAANHWKTRGDPVVRFELPSSSESAWKPPYMIAEEKKRKEEQRKPREEEKYRRLGENDINFHILMRTTSEGDSKAIKRLGGGTSDYFQYLRGDYGQGPLGTVHDYGALSKIFFFSHISEVITYMQEGKWEGDEWEYMSMSEETPDEKKNYVFMPGRPVPKDIHGRPLPVDIWYKAWDKTPSVDRSVVKIHRFDYFGHADRTNFILSYGWKNKKGELPDFDYFMKRYDLVKCFTGNVLTHDASASLWGCSLGATPTDGTPGIAQLLSDKFFMGGVVASEDRTLFHRILDHDSSMPEPVSGTWKLFLNQSGKPE